ncbi:bifunctional transcriptional activator/DNA repair enzyme AdaA [Cohnella suwonensis]|uniref:Bifunctional transcriptional activator/DNA repair enzyme AdaA n=1 Tax=Cohnella suwonensis TaxID=696072 RepID=A0ABW0M5E7_9BACL
MYDTHETRDAGETAAMSDEQWRAIVLCDAEYDGKFYYAVKTTGIYCRPSCRSRVPARNNVKVFANSEQAVAERFRPCKRCKPEGGKLPAEEWIARIAADIDEHYSESLSLSQLADRFHASPYHLQRTFKKIKGVSPTEYMAAIRMAKAKELLAESSLSISEVGLAVGIGNASHFSTQFASHAGMTPSQYRKRAEQSVITATLEED